MIRSLGSCRPLTERCDLLDDVVSIEGLVLGVGEKRERKRSLLVDVIADTVAGAARRNGQHLRIAGYELVVVLTQLRKVLAAVGSEESAQEDQYDTATTEVAQAGRTARFVGQREVGCDRTHGHGRTVDEHFPIVPSTGPLAWGNMGS